MEEGKREEEREGRRDKRANLHGEREREGKKDPHTSGLQKAKARESERDPQVIVGNESSPVHMQATESDRISQRENQSKNQRENLDPIPSFL